ncbi:hypothetical protein GW17_00022575, partial [Ensete ventricosum]
VWLHWLLCDIVLLFSFKSSRRMGDHLALLVDHLLTESTLEAAIGSRKHGDLNSASLEDPAKEFTRKSHVRGSTSVGKLVDCRICQEEDEDYNMEIPCSCCGSLKQFKPGYTAPPKLFRYGSIPMDFRYPICGFLWYLGIRGNAELHHLHKESITDCVIIFSQRQLGDYQTGSA